MAKFDYVPYSGPIVTRAEARQEGSRRYFLGKACRHGHVSQWFVHGGCVQCHAIDRRKNDEIYSKQRDRKLVDIAGREKPKVCDVCGKSGRIVFDHCRTSMKFRGWLCNRCNLAVGILLECPETMRSLAMYIEKFRGSCVQGELPQFRISKRGFIIPLHWKKTVKANG